MMWGGGPYGGMMDYWGGGWFGMLFAGFFGLVVLVGLVLLAVWAVRAISAGGGAAGSAAGATPGGQPTPGVPAADPALTIARERYAKGEITKEELDEILRTLGGG